MVVVVGHEHLRVPPDAQGFRVLAPDALALERELATQPPRQIIRQRLHFPVRRAQVLDNDDQVLARLQAPINLIPFL